MDARGRAAKSLPAFAKDIMDTKEAARIGEEILAMPSDEFAAMGRITHFTTGKWIVGYNVAYGWYKSPR